MTEKDFAKKDSYFWQYLNKEMNKKDRALAYANLCHEGQIRKYSKLPYITHLILVSSYIKSIMNQIELENEDLEVAGILHETIQNTCLDIKNLEMRFGKEVSEIIISNNVNEEETFTEQVNNKIKKIKENSIEKNILILADNLAEINEISKYKKAKGETIFKTLKAGKYRQQRYYERVREELKEYFEKNNYNIPEELNIFNEYIEKVFILNNK